MWFGGLVGRFPIPWTISENKHSLSMMSSNELFRAQSEYMHQGIDWFVYRGSLLTRWSQQLCKPKESDNYLWHLLQVLTLLTIYWQVSNEPGTHYNVPLMNALVLYVGTQAITYIHSKSGTPSMSTITHSSHMDIFQNLAVDLDTEGINKS